MTLEQFFEVKHQFQGTWCSKHDTIVVNAKGWAWYYYGTLIAKYSDEEVQLHDTLRVDNSDNSDISIQLYKLKYSTSTTRRHNIVRRYYSL